MASPPHGLPLKLYRKCSHTIHLSFTVNGLLASFILKFWPDIVYFFYCTFRSDTTGMKLRASGQAAVHILWFGSAGKSSTNSPMGGTTVCHSNNAATARRAFDCRQENWKWNLSARWQAGRSLWWNPPWDLQNKVKASSECQTLLWSNHWRAPCRVKTEQHILLISEIIPDLSHHHKHSPKLVLGTWLVCCSWFTRLLF